jgi:hypothetical protein
MQRTIEILIGPDGTLTIDAVGFQGADCEEATQFLETTLGVTAHKRHKPESQQKRCRQHQQRIGA